MGPTILVVGYFELLARRKGRNSARSVNGHEVAPDVPGGGRFGSDHAVPLVVAPVLDGADGRSKRTERLRWFWSLLASYVVRPLFSWHLSLPQRRCRLTKRA